MAFDARGRLFVGQGPQYRRPTPETPGDTVEILLDTDGDGIAETAKTFAEGFNSIQGLSWHGQDLWVGNSPDLTIARDLDGDDVADEYVKVFTDIGNLEHANHGHNWAPDGKFYFSQGNAKGLTQPPERVAPLPFRELWDVEAPPGTPDFPAPQVFSREEYQRAYHDPEDDWGREGGILRSDDMGKNLEIVSRGMRNAWDIAFDSGFNWLGTDNDQWGGDRIFMPFFKAHFGWGHSWSTDWTGIDNLPTVPVSGPTFDGASTGVLYYDFPQLPLPYQGVWFINDFERKTTFAYHPRWEGALLQPEGEWQPFASGGPRRAGVLYQPVDLVVGPDGSLYVSGWGSELGATWGEDGRQTNEGRIFRISWPDGPEVQWNKPKRNKPLQQWTADELLEDLGSQLPVWNIDAQDELVRRGGATLIRQLEARLERKNLTEAQETWTLWTLGRLAPQDLRIEKRLAKVGQKRSLNARIQAIRIAGHRIREHRPTDTIPSFVSDALDDPEPRIRFAAVQSIMQARQKQMISELAALAAKEKDRVTFYATWQALRELSAPEKLRSLIKDPRAGVRTAAFLALTEDRRMDREEVQPFVEDSDPTVSTLAATWLAKEQGNQLITIYPQPGVYVDSVEVRLNPGVKPGEVRYTTDGSEPTLDSFSDGPDDLTETTTLKVALFVNERQVGNTLVATYGIRKADSSLPEVGGVTERATLRQVLPLLPNADASKGQALFRAANCIACHRVGNEGKAVGPDLSAIGDRTSGESIINSILMPNQTVVEGYALRTVSTRAGETYAGILAGETDKTLNLVQLNGEPLAIDKTTITSHESTHQSPMPPYEYVFTPSQLAELVAWLLEKRELPVSAQ